MYKLTLTKSHRSAFDWIGNRYAAGAIATVLGDCTDEDWDSDEPITFNVPEHKAWEIKTLADDGWPCFTPDLVALMEDFLSQII